MRYLYTLCIYLALPFIFLRLAWKSRKNPRYRQRWAERLGYCPHHLKNCIWIHAVSLGETIAAIPLIKKLKLLYPDLPFLVTNMTPTGAERAKMALGDSVLHAHIPYDFPGSVGRFLDRVKPLSAIVMETELWPNLFFACKKRNIPIVIANARLSEKSANGYRLIGSMTREMLHEITMLASQGKKDAERFIELGLAKEKCVVTGNLKFDLELPADLAAKHEILKKQLGTRPIWIAASTHPGEEEIILAAHKLVRKECPDALLILVPRHPERFDGVYQLVQNQQLSVVRRSSGEPVDENISVYLGDSVGELMLLYSGASVAFVGGSLVSVGGHNMLEPAALHKAIITGPQLFNFAEISQMLLDARGMIKIQDATGLASTVVRFFKDEDARKISGEKAYHVVEQNRGSLQKQIDIIQKTIEEK